MDPGVQEDSFPIDPRLLESQHTPPNGSNGPET